MSRKLNQVNEENAVVPFEAGNSLVRLIQTRGPIVDIALPDDLPSIFKNAEVIDSSFPPVVQWDTEGQWAYGIYKSTKRDVGTYNSNVHVFDVPLPSGEFFKWSIWGSAVVDAVIEECERGDVLLFFFTGFVPTDKKDMRDFKVLRIRKGEIDEKGMKELAVRMKK